MFLGLTIGHFIRPQRLCRLATFLETLARASTCLWSLLPTSLAMAAILVGSPILLMASMTLLTLLRMAFSLCLAPKPTAWKKWSLSSITAIFGAKWAKKATRD